MSALGGIYHFDGAPVDDNLLVALGQALDKNGPDGGKEIKSGFVGMAYRAFHTNKESRLERQPLVSPIGPMICWDGRLDNRDDLLHQLREDLTGDLTDVGIVMAGYLRWGIDFLPRLIGDFALSLWDPNRRLLLLARDPFGARSLFYHSGKERLIWASLLGPLVDLSYTSLAINDEYIAGYLTDEPEPSITPYKSIYSVPPGAYITQGCGQIITCQYWTLNRSRRICYKNDREYEEHFRDVFRDAVRSRLRSDQVVFAELSGGLDSSSVVCVADSIIKAGEAETYALETISYLYDEAPTSDERAFVACVETKRGKEGHHLKEEDHRILARLEEQSPLFFPSVFQLFARRHRAVSDVMRESGGRVLLTGQIGDHILWSQAEGSPELADMLLHLNLLGLHRLAKSWSRIQNTPYVEVIWKGVIWPLLPSSIRARSPLAKPAKWLDKTFVKNMNLREPTLRVRDAFRLPSSRLRYRLLLSAIGWASRGYYQERACIEVSHPYLHRPLIEFLLAIPFEQLLRPGETRSIQRRALRNYLSDRIVTRRGKRGPDEAVYRALAREWSRIEAILSDARIRARGYVDLRTFRDELQRARYGRATQSHMILKTISLELWLRSSPQSAIL